MRIREPCSIILAVRDLVTNNCKGLYKPIYVGHLSHKMFVCLEEETTDNAMTSQSFWL